MLTPAQRLAALQAIQYGVDQMIEQAKQEVRAAMDASGADRFRTGLGTVGLATQSDRISFDEDQLRQFAEGSGLDGIETIRQVRSTFRNLFTIDGDDVIFEPTGEQVTFAKVRHGTQYIRTALDPQAKEHAVWVLAGNPDVMQALYDRKNQ